MTWEGDAAAAAFLQRAVELDPKFASAYWKLALTHYDIGELEAARQYSQKAYELRDSVSERERCYFRAVRSAGNRRYRQGHPDLRGLLEGISPRSVCSRRLRLSAGDPGPVGAGHANYAPRVIAQVSFDSALPFELRPTLAVRRSSRPPVRTCTDTLSYANVSSANSARISEALAQINSPGLIALVQPPVPADVFP